MSSRGFGEVDGGRIWCGRDGDGPAVVLIMEALSVICECVTLRAPSAGGDNDRGA